MNLINHFSSQPIEMSMSAAYNMLAMPGIVHVHILVSGISTSITKRDRRSDRHRTESMAGDIRGVGHPSTSVLRSNHVVDSVNRLCHFCAPSLFLDGINRRRKAGVQIIFLKHQE